MRRGYDVTIIDEWFERDDNAEPAVYRLRSIDEIFTHYDDNEHEELQKKVYLNLHVFHLKFIIVIDTFSSLFKIWLIRCMHHHLIHNEFNQLCSLKLSEERVFCEPSQLTFDIKLVANLHYCRIETKAFRISIKDKAKWNQTQDKLQTMLRAASDEAYTDRLISKEARHVYFKSGTQSFLDLS